MMDQHRAAVAESLLAIRPGEPGKSPFWNGHARQFIVAPAFDFKPVERAASYRFVLTFEDGTSRQFRAAEPWLKARGGYKQQEE